LLSAGLLKVALVAPGISVANLPRRQRTLPDQLAIIVGGHAGWDPRIYRADREGEPSTRSTCTGPVPLALMRPLKKIDLPKFSGT